MLNQLIIKTMPLVPKFMIHQVAKKYIAGDVLQDAVNKTLELQKEGGWSTIDVLGEFVDNKERALHEKAMSSKVLDAINDNKLHSYLSIKPTSLGLGIDVKFSYLNIKELLQKSREFGLNVCIDMENSPYTDKTIDLYRRFRDEGFDNVSIVIQAYMRRSYKDIESLLSYKPSIRLCKGIYKEAPEIAYQEKQEVRDNYKKLFELIVENKMYIGIATHDEELINYAEERIKSLGMKKEEYEFQMLLGVREDRRSELLRQGHHLRVYVPFGVDWYGYYTRRLKENPQIAGHIFKAIFTNK